MKSVRLCSTLLFGFSAIAGVVRGQTPPPPPPPPAGSSTAPARAQLEKQFEEELSNSVLTGIWQMTGQGGLSGKAALTEPKPDQYAIAGVSKLAGDQWVVQARIQYADKDVTVPVPVRVVWAEDTAIITLNDLFIPLIGTYSARVMIHHGFYSGVWYCGEKNYGGVMQGRIEKSPPVEEKPTKPADSPPPPAQPTNGSKPG